MLRKDDLEQSVAFIGGRLCFVSAALLFDGNESRAVPKLAMHRVQKFDAPQLWGTRAAVGVMEAHELSAAMSLW